MPVIIRNTGVDDPLIEPNFGNHEMLGENQTNDQKAVCMIFDKSWVQADKDKRLVRIKSPPGTTWNTLGDSQIGLALEYLNNVMKKTLDNAFEPYRSGLTGGPPVPSSIQEIVDSYTEEVINGAWKTSFKFDKQNIISGNGTGFHIGDGILLTAGHCLDDVIDKMCCAFNLTGNLAEKAYPLSNFFEFESYLLKIVPPNKLDPSDPDFWGPFREKMNVEKAFRGCHPALYDAAVAKIRPWNVPNAVQNPGPFPPRLILTDNLPPNKTPVALYGHPAGLPMVVDRQGRMLKRCPLYDMQKDVPYNVFDAEPILLNERGDIHSGTFCADVDNFGGNSGGPVITSDGVIGLSRGAPYIPFAIPKIDGQTNLNLAKKVIEYRQSINGGNPDLVPHILTEFFHVFDQTYLTNDNVLRWQRTQGGTTNNPLTNGVGISMTTFTRTDPYKRFVYHSLEVPPNVLPVPVPISRSAIRGIGLEVTIKDNLSKNPDYAGTQLIFLSVFKPAVGTAAAVQTPNFITQPRNPYQSTDPADGTRRTNTWLFNMDLPQLQALTAAHKQTITDLRPLSEWCNNHLCQFELRSNITGFLNHLVTQTLHAELVVEVSAFDFEPTAEIYVFKCGLATGPGVVNGNICTWNLAMGTWQGPVQGF